MKSELKPKSLLALADAYPSALKVNPEYQRGTKWNLAQKQSLIDSLLCGYHVPLFYVHLVRKKNAFTGAEETTAWLVDGQQRLAAIKSYLQNEFPLSNPQTAAPGSVLPFTPEALPSWSGKTFEELATTDRERLLGRELLVVEMSEDASNEVRDLFIRLQAGTPLTAQEKRDAWPGSFTLFVIRHAGKPGHPQSKPKPFFNLFPHSRGLTVDDGDHYVDGLANARKFFAGLAMTIMVRERSDLDFVDLKGKTINDFYKENLDLRDDDPAAQRVTRALDRVAELPRLENLREGKRMSFQMAFHFALLVDSLTAGNYVPGWRDNIVDAFMAFQEDVAKARLHYRQTHESLPHHERFVRLLGGSGSDTADVIRSRHSFLLAQVYPKIRIVPRDPNRCFDVLEKEVIWNRDRAVCQNPGCGRRVPFREAHIHHVVEHTAGGPTILQNGVLICADCHRDRGAMQRLTSHFQEYLQRIYNPPQQTADNAVMAAPIGAVGEQAEFEDDAAENGARSPAGRLKIVIDWGALDVDCPQQTISEDQSSASIVKLLVELIDKFGDPMKQQLTELPIIRYPLSKNHATDFLNRATGKRFSSLPVPGTGLHFCPHSGNAEKIKRLGVLFSLLTLPDGRDFPPGSVEISLAETSHE